MKTKELDLSEKIERRLEMIHAHTKLEKAPFGCKSILARAKHWMVPIS